MFHRRALLGTFSPLKRELSLSLFLAHPFLAQPSEFHSNTAPVPLNRSMLRDHWTQGLKELSQPPVPAEILKNFSNVASDVLCDLRAFSYDPENANRAQRFTVQELAECIYDYTAKRVASMGVLMFVADDTSQLPARRRATEKPADKIDPKCVPEAVASGFTASALELILKNRDARMPFLAAVGRAFVETCFTHRHPHVRRLVLHNFAEDASSGRRLLQARHPLRLYCFATGGVVF